MSLGAIFGGIGGAVSAAGAIQGLLAKPTNYGSQQDFSSGRGYLNQLSGLGNTYAAQASNAMNDYSADNGQYRSAVQNYGNYLQQDPFTDQRSTADLARATTGSADAYSRARANLQASGAAAGVGGAGSSSLMGGMAGIEAGEAGSLAGAQNNQAYAQIAQHQQNMQALTNLYGGVSGQDYSRGTQALGAQQGVDNGLASTYLGLGQTEFGEEQNMDAQQRQASAGALGNLGSILGSKAGFSAGTAGYSPSSYSPQPSSTSYPPLPSGNFGLPNPVSFGVPLSVQYNGGNY